MASHGNTHVQSQHLKDEAGILQVQDHPGLQASSRSDRTI
jgi:hypothetical protein